MLMYLLFSHISHIVALNFKDFNIDVSSLSFNFSDSFIESKKEKDLRMLTDQKIANPPIGVEIGVLKHQQEYIANTFDVRDYYAFCKDLIDVVPDQGNCTAGWAFATSSVMTDRICIKSYGKNRTRISPEDVVSCCLSCKIYVNGCLGGSVRRVWRFWETRGLVTGGFYAEEEAKMKGCKPYSNNSFIKGVASLCQYNCTNSNYTKKYFKDKIRGKRVYRIPNDVEQIQIEIKKNGPVVAQMEVYGSFFLYSDGIYRRPYKDLRFGWHYVKLIGWGKKQGIEYWLGINSWGTNWGNNGTFKILKGRNECEIESKVTAGKSIRELEDGEFYSGFEPQSLFTFYQFLKILLIILIPFFS